MMKSLHQVLLVVPFVVLVSSFSTAPIRSRIAHRPGRITPLTPTGTTTSPTTLGAVAIPLDDTTFDESILDDDEQWIRNLDYQAFAKDVNDLGKELLQSTGDKDVQHLNKIIKWRNAFALVGVATMWTRPNPLTIIALSTWTYASWTMIAHHVSHGGYNRVNAGKYNSRGFAIGSVKRRLLDWADWMLPEAWNVEHNRLHHYHLGEDKDPDNVQRNLAYLRDMKVPNFFKYVMIAAKACIWKWFYYAPNTYKELQIQEMKRTKQDLPEGLQPTESFTFMSILNPTKQSQFMTHGIVNIKDFFAKVLAPVLLARFVLLPAPLLLVPQVGTTWFRHALTNLVLADIVTNLHSFLTIVTNHVGKDVYVFDDQVRPKTGAFYVRQIVGSVNYNLGSDPIDFMHGWLNYQIEHHVWPDLSMRQYQIAAPKLKAICAKHGVPYIQESVFERLRKTCHIMIGKTNMRNFPTQLEPEADKAGANGVQWKATHGALVEA